jgi:mRNA-degrading endonuclease RelE of RelBE toxin-antitoxin system
LSVPQINTKQTKITRDAAVQTQPLTRSIGVQVDTKCRFVSKSTQTDPEPIDKKHQEPVQNQYRRRRGESVTRKERKILKCLHQNLQTENSTRSPKSKLKDAQIITKTAALVGVIIVK